MVKNASLTDFERVDSGIRYGMWDFKPLSRLAQHVTYLVDGLIEEHSPFVLCAQRKTMKTRTLVDLAVSLASGGSFLGLYRCNKSKVLFACAEDGEAVIRRACYLVANARGLNFDPDRDLQVMAHGGRIDESSLKHLARRLTASGPGTTLIIDPAKDYFGGLESASSQLSFLLGQLRDTCRQCKTTLILSCHSTKSAESLDLGMMQGTAYASVAGGWWLMRRRGSYKMDGVHNLDVRFGGRTGCAGSLAFTIDEQLIDGEPTGHYLSLPNCDTTKNNRAELDAILEALSGVELSQNAILKKLKNQGHIVGQSTVRKHLEFLSESGAVARVDSEYRGKQITKYSLTIS